MENPTNGNKTALIAVGINIILTLLFINTFGILVSGIYLGVSKNIGTKTRPLFFIISFIFFLIDEGLVKQRFFQTESLVRGVSVEIFSSLMLAAIPLGIMWIIKKLRHT